MVNPQLACGLTGRTGDALEEYKKRLLELNNEVVVASPKDLEINTHVCRGNYHSTSLVQVLMIVWLIYYLVRKM